MKTATKKSAAKVRTPIGGGGNGPIGGGVRSKAILIKISKRHAELSKLFLDLASERIG
jgi:hypothetical protein